jgi:hypothetical protein
VVYDVLLRPQVQIEVWRAWLQPAPLVAAAVPLQYAHDAAHGHITVSNDTSRMADAYSIDINSTTATLQLPSCSSVGIIVE